MQHELNFICSKSSNPLDLSQNNPRAKCQYFTEALAASVNTDFFQEEKSWSLDYPKQLSATRILKVLSIKKFRKTIFFKLLQLNFKINVLKLKP